MSFLSGHVLGRHQFNDLILTELRYDGPKQAPRHAHKLAFFRLLLDGYCAERCGPATVTYAPFTVLFHPPGVEHQDDIGPQGAHFFTIELNEPWLHRIGSHRLMKTPLVDLNGGDLLWLSLQLYREYDRLPNPVSEFAMEGIALEMLATAARCYSVMGAYPGPRWFQRVLVQLLNSFTSNITLNELAAAAGVHPVHLSRVFQRFTGRTFGEYLQRLRVQYACRQMSSPDALLSQIAIASGFSDQSHFTHVFKEISGMTPGLFRDLLPRPEPLQRVPVRPPKNAVHPSVEHPRPIRELVSGVPR